MRARLKPRRTCSKRCLRHEEAQRELSRGDRIGILLFEDGDVRKNRYTLTAPNNVLMLSTAQFLMGLEREGSSEMRTIYSTGSRVPAAWKSGTRICTPPRALKKELMTGVKTSPPDPYRLP